MPHGIKSLKAQLLKRLAGRQAQAIRDRRAGVDAISSFGDQNSSDDLQYIDLGGVKTAVFSAAPTDTGPLDFDDVIIYVHGGAFVAGSAKSHQSLCWNLHKATGSTVFAPEYSLAPEHAHPQSKMDILAVIGAICGASQRPIRYSIAGDSAGATLALLCVVQMRQQGDHMPESLVLISPLTDLTCMGGSYDDRKDLDPFITRDGLLKDICNYAGSSHSAPRKIMAEYADLTGLPPTLVQVGQHEVLLDDARAFAASAEAAGVSVQLEIWPEMIHVWHLFPDYLEQSSRAIENIALFLKRGI